MPTTFRHATLDDVDFIVAVNRLPHVTPAINPVDAERVRARIAEGIAHFIAERAGERLGFVIASVEDDWLLHVHRLAARAPGEGTGSFLLREVLRWGFEHRNARRAYLEVLASNAGARRLYERFGFTLEGTFREGFRDLAGEYHDLCAYGMLVREQRG